MAPELFWGKPASIRSDIYALGVVLYQLLAGDFSRPVTTDWAKQIKDPLLREDLEKCFAGDPQDRFVSGFGPRSAYAWSAENTKQVVYADTKGHIIELFVFVGGQWSWADLTTITGAPVAEPEGENIVGYAWSGE